MSLSSYPNSFKTDTINIDDTLTYNFNVLYNLSPITTTNIIPNSKYAKITVPTQANNIKFKNFIYSFNGLFITTTKDVLDMDTTHSHCVLIECVNNILNKTLYISLPVMNDASTDNALDKIFDSSVKVLEDLNEFIPLVDKFYSYTTSGIQEFKRFDVIVYKNSSLKINYAKLGLPDDIIPTTSIIIPLTISKNNAYKVPSISATYSESDIYIDCQPADDTNQDSVVTVFTTNHKIYNLVKYILPFLVIFGLFYIILYYS